MMFSLKFTAVLCKGLLSAIDNDPKFDLLGEEVDTKIKGGLELDVYAFFEWGIILILLFQSETRGRKFHDQSHF